MRHQRHPQEATLTPFRKAVIGATAIALLAVSESVAPLGPVESATAATVGTGSCVQEVTDPTDVSVSLLQTGGKSYCVVTFGNTDATTNWTIPAGVTEADVLIVGGGGGGGSVEWAGGGGAGGVLYGEGLALSSLASNGAISVTVGDGGSGGQNTSDVDANAPDSDGGASRRGSNGGDSSFGSAVAAGGGGGGGKGWNVPYNGQGNSGGSGGGSAEHGNGSLRNGELLYEVTNPNRVNGAIVYTPSTVNNASAFDARDPQAAITRVTYRMEVTVDGIPRFAEVSFDPWANNLTAADLKVPDLVAGNQVVIEGFVQNMRVDSNLGAGDIARSTGVITSSAPADRVGYLEIWPWNYAQGKKLGFDRGSGSVFDFNDTHAGDAVTKGDHGSFQVHDVTTEGEERTVLAWNLHREGLPDGVVAEIGLGNWTGAHPDWTGSGNDSFGTTDWKLQIMVNKDRFQSLDGGASALTAPTGFTAYGNPGGSVDSVGSRAGSGGGGAGAPGGVSPFTSFQFINDTVENPQVAGNGGDGRLFEITGEPVVYAGGGGGGAGQQLTDTCGLGGSGGGGDGGCGKTGTVVAAGDGEDGLGGGGGGARSGVGGQGGSGVVIVRYELAPPGLATPNVTGLTTTAATAGSTVTSPQTAVSERGFVVGTSTNPTRGASGVTEVSSGTGVGAFTANLTGLTPGTTYHVRAYAMNGGGTAYSQNQTFTTVAATTSPTKPTRPTSPNGDSGQNVAPSPTNGGGSQTLPPPRIPTPGSPPPPLAGPLPGLNGGGQAPQAPTALIGGRPATVDTNVVSPNQLGLQIGDATFGMTVPEGQGSVSSSGGNTELAIEPGAQKNLSGTGLFPGSTVQVFMPLGPSGSREIAQFPVGPNGAFNGEAVFTTRPTDPPLPIGRHVLQIASLNDAGERVIVEMAINIAQGAPRPEHLLSTGVPPTLVPGQSLATAAGEPIAVTITVNAEERTTVVDGGDWTFSVNLPGQGSAMEQNGDGGALIRILRGGEAIVIGNGFLPNSRADIWLFSDPTLLGSVEIDESGEFNGTVVVDGRVVPVGDHTLQIQGVGVDGFVLAANLGVVVADPDTDTTATTEQAATGVLWWVLALIVLLVVAGVVWWVVRRRANPLT